MGSEARGGRADAAAAACNDEHLHLPRMNSRSRSAMVSWYHVGRPWLQLPERSVSSISRSSAFISAMLSARCARTAAWQAIVARSSFWREDRTWLAPNSRISASTPRARPTISPPASATGARAPRARSARYRELEAQALERFAVLFRSRHIQCLGLEKRRYEQRLSLHRSGVKVRFQLLHHDALVRRVHIHEDESGLVLRQDVDAMELRKRIAERRGFFGDGERLRRPMNA